MAKNEAPQPRKVFIPYPPPQVFRHSNLKKEPDVLDTVRDQHEPQYLIERFDYPITGGQYVYHVGSPYPVKGHVYPPALMACEVPKRVLVSWLGFLADKNLALPYLAFAILPRKLKAKILNSFLYWYLQVANIHLQPHYLADRFYIDINRELRGFIIKFLTEYGVSMEISCEFALAMITILEYDSAYRFRVEDLLSETTKEKLMANPVKEFQRLVRILTERDHREHLVAKFDRLAWVFKYAFWFIKKPFFAALKEINLEKMQFDDIDRYQVCHYSGYNFFGETIEQRLEKYKKVQLPRSYVK